MKSIFNVFNSSTSKVGFSGRGVWFVRPSRIIWLIVILLIVLPLCLHYFLSRVVSESSQNYDRHLLIDVEDSLAVISGITCDSLKSRVQELLNIKGSVSTELRDLEQKRQMLQESVAQATSKIENLRMEESRLNTELQRLKMSVNQAYMVQRELYEKNMPEIHAPFRLTASHLDNYFLSSPSKTQVAHCRMFNCFDYSRCSLLSGFPVYFYDVDKYRVSSTDLDAFVKTTVRQAVGYNSHITSNPDEACIFIALVGETIEKSSAMDKQLLESNLQSLPFWNGDGRNHVLLNLARTDSAKDIFHSVNTGRAIIVQSHFYQFRPTFDLLSPPLLGLAGGDLWHDLPAIVPARRMYLLSFQGRLPIQMDGKQPPRKDSPIMQELSLIEELTKLTSTPTSDKFHLEFSCHGPPMEKDSMSGLIEWGLCGTITERSEMLQSSTFSLILTPPSGSMEDENSDLKMTELNYPHHYSSSALQLRVFEGLKHGSIPVILGNNVELPFAENLDWNRIVFVLPKVRVPELHYFLRTISDADILSMRRQGRQVWEKYLGSTQAILDTILATIRQRINLPPPPALTEPSPSVFNDSFVPLKTDSIIPEPDTDENLGPIEPPFPSITFQRNFSWPLTGGYKMWNDVLDPFYLYPNLPVDPILPSEAQFSGSKVGFRPINKGAGGSGKEFSENLGGNSPREQFTIVMLTFEREQVLVNSLARLYGLPYLNKVIVVWNSARPPPDNLKWPDLKVPIQVIRAERNSLNNRFLPFDEIETEAILSVDDDAHLRHDEIVFGFRVWREERDRVVGFPGRFHAWDLDHNAWLYNSNYSCQLSMVLTGAAFFHKHYSYMYSQVMPQAIRDKVDEYMNCEDIAMNFIVSHITRKPPVKVTSRWTFRCPGCPISLSEDDSHFMERHKCINYFSQVFGYNPLLNTQYRVDSVLFKTRLPQDKQKCFKFI